MGPELSIDELEPSGILNWMRFEKNVWTKCYVSAQAALADAVLLDDVPY